MQCEEGSGGGQQRSAHLNVLGILRYGKFIPHFKEKHCVRYYLGI